LINIIFRVTFTQKKGRGVFCIKRTTGFTVILTRSSRDSGRKKNKKPEQTLYITCRSQSFTNTTIKTATAVHLSRPEEALTKIALGHNFYKKCVVEGKGINKKVMK
jgi:hypothetical protein